jgi:hypothetical protein
LNTPVQPPIAFSRLVAFVSPVFVEVELLEARLRAEGSALGLRGVSPNRV